MRCWRRRKEEMGVAVSFKANMANKS